MAKLDGQDFQDGLVRVELVAKLDGQERQE